jgi:O-antigen/teichoic acid export membrane protein
LFNIAAQISNAYYLVVSSSITGQVPKAYDKLIKENGNRSAVNFYLKYIGFVSTVLFILSIPSAYIFLYFFKDGEFLPSFLVVLILLVGQFIFLFYNYYHVIVTFHRQNKFLTYSLLLGVSTSLLLAFILIKPLQLVGAAVPLAIGYAIQLLVIGMLVSKKIKTK